MEKKIKDINKEPVHSQIDLKGKVFKKKKHIKKDDSSIYKEETPIKEVRDLYSKKQQNYIYKYVL